MDLRLVAWTAASIFFACAPVACFDLDGLTVGGGPCDGGPCDGGGIQPLPDSASDTATPVECKPGDVTTFTPSWKPPTGRQQGKCTTTQVGQFVACLFSQAANDASCLDYMERPENAICGACILSPVDAPAYGPLVRLGVDRITVNVEGCASVVLSDISAKSCGAKAQALAQCRAAACAKNCPLTDRPSLLAYNECEQAAGTTVCKGYVDASACIYPLVGPGGAAEICASAPTPLEAATQVAQLFCGQ